MVLGDQFSGCDKRSIPGLLQRRPGHPPRALRPQMDGGQSQAGNFLSQGIITQLGPVANDYFLFQEIFQLCPQLLQGDGPVLPQAGQLPALRQKDGVIDLLPPGVHGTDNIPLQMG